jgi:hypothetical protein
MKLMVVMVALAVAGPQTLPLVLQLVQEELVHQAKAITEAHLVRAHHTEAVAVAVLLPLVEMRLMPIGAV